MLKKAKPRYTTYYGKKISDLQIGDHVVILGYMPGYSNWKIIKKISNKEVQLKYIGGNDVFHLLEGKNYDEIVTAKLMKNYLVQFEWLVSHGRSLYTGGPLIESLNSPEIKYLTLPKERRRNADLKR